MKTPTPAPPPPGQGGDLEKTLVKSRKKLTFFAISLYRAATAEQILIFEANGMETKSKNIDHRS